MTKHERVRDTWGKAPEVEIFNHTDEDFLGSQSVRVVIKFAYGEVTIIGHNDIAQQVHVLGSDNAIMISVDGETIKEKGTYFGETMDAIERIQQRIDQEES